MIRYNHDQKERNNKKKITQNNTAKIIVTNVEHHHASSSIHKNKRNRSKINQKINNIKKEFFFQLNRLWPQQIVMKFVNLLPDWKATEYHLIEKLFLCNFKIRKKVQNFLTLSVNDSVVNNYLLSKYSLKNVHCCWCESL